MRALSKVGPRLFSQLSPQRQMESLTAGLSDLRLSSAKTLIGWSPADAGHVCADAHVECPDRTAAPLKHIRSVWC